MEENKRNLMHAALVYKRIESNQKLVFLVCVLLAASTFLLSLPHILVRGHFNISHVPHFGQKQPIRGENHILFIETSCAYGDFRPPRNAGLGLILNVRRACSIESAARANPNSTVYLLYTCPIHENRIEASSVFVIRLLKYANVQIYQINLDDYFKGTPIEPFYKSGGWNNSPRPAKHSSDVLRYLTLWKYGGTYLDLDMIVKRSIADLGTNFAGAESSHWLGSDVLNFGMDKTGRDVATACINIVTTMLSSDNWMHNGSKVITSVMQRLCHTTEISLMTPARCSGFTVHPETTFFPIFHRDLDLLFDPSKRNMSERLTRHMVHSSDHSNVELGSNQPFGLLAQEFCPEVYQNSGPMF